MLSAMNHRVVQLWVGERSSGATKYLCNILPFEWSCRPGDYLDCVTLLVCLSNHILYLSYPVLEFIRPFSFTTSILNVC